MSRERLSESLRNIAQHHLKKKSGKSLLCNTVLAYKYIGENHTDHVTQSVCQVASIF